MNYCNMPKILADFLLVYLFSNIFYLLKTRNIGTPFNDSLNDVQKKIKQASASLRRKIFYQGMMLGFILVIILKPFKSCN